MEQSFSCVIVRFDRVSVFATFPLLVPLRHGVEAPAAERIAPQHAPHREHDADKRSPLLYRLYRVLRACRRKAARRHTFERRYEALIQADYGDERAANHFLRTMMPSEQSQRTSMRFRFPHFRHLLFLRSVPVPISFPRRRGRRACPQARVLSPSI